MYNKPYIKETTGYNEEEIVLHKVKYTSDIAMQQSISDLELLKECIKHKLSEKELKLLNKVIKDLNIT